MANSITQLKDSIQELIPIMRQLAQAQQVVEKAQEDLQDTVEKTENVFFRMQKTIAGEGEGGISKAFKTMNKFGYALIPMYFKLKNQVETSLIVFGKFWDGVTGKGKVGLVGGVFRKVRQDFLRTREMFEKDGPMQGPILKRTSSDTGVTTSSFFSKPQGLKGTLFNIKKNIKNSTASSIKFVKNLKKINIMGIFKNLGAFALVALKYIFFATLGVSLLISFFKSKTFSNAFEKVREFLETMYKIFVFGFTLIKDGFITIYEAFSKGGSFINIFINVLKGIGQIILGILTVLFGVVVTVLGTALVFIGKVLYDGFVKVIKYLARVVLTLGVIVGGISILFGIGYLLVAGITALPFLIGAAIVTGLSYALGKGLGFFANGGVVGSGMQVVGEKGPELVKLPQGSRVYSNSDSRKMLSNGQTNNITVNVQGRIGASDAELRQIAQKVGQMINREINRTTSSRTGA